MYTDYWQLERKPFEPSADDRDYYPSETHQGALLKLRYAIDNQRGAAVLAGPSGSGKTLLVETLRRQLRDDLGPFVHLVFPQMNNEELLAYLASQLGAIPSGTPRGGVDETVHRIESFLGENTREGRHAVVAIDEAHLLCENGALETIRLLLNFEQEGRPGLTLLLVGQPAMLPAISRMRGLDDRIGVKMLLRPFTLEETVSYVNHRLTAAGASKTIFDSEALEALHHLTHGVARQINRLGDLTLLIGFAEELPCLSAEHIESVCDELVTIRPE